MMNDDDEFGSDETEAEAPASSPSGESFIPAQDKARKNIRFSAIRKFRQSNFRSTIW